MSQEDKRRILIKGFVEHSGMSLQDAEFAAAIELGEITGDRVTIESEAKTTAKRRAPRK